MRTKTPVAQRKNRFVNDHAVTSPGTRIAMLHDSAPCDVTLARCHGRSGRRGGVVEVVASHADLQALAHTTHLGHDDGDAMMVEGTVRVFTECDSHCGVVGGRRQLLMEGTVLWAESSGPLSGARQTPPIAAAFSRRSCS